MRTVRGREKKRKPFQNSKRSEQPLEAVSTDRTGLITLPDLEGSIFMQLQVDGATSHTQGFPIREKAEAADTILDGIRMMNVAVGSKIKRYHTTKVTPRSREPRN